MTHKREIRAYNYKKINKSQRKIVKKRETKESHIEQKKMNKMAIVILYQ